MIMKKIIAILSGVAILFASCENGGNSESKPTFPEVQTLAVEAGASYDITFVAEKPWTVSLSAESQQYATLRYESYTDTQHAGPAGENTIKVNVRSGVGSYVKDIVFDVDITMAGYTEDLAMCTIAKSTKVVNVTGDINPGSSAISTFTAGGHPENGPFADALYTYTVTHYKGNDAQEANIYVQHDVDVLYNYVVYAKNSDGEFVKIDINEESRSWLELVSFGVNGARKFRLYMYYDSKDAVKTPGVGYEAYVNIEDAAKNVMVSVYHVYNPDTEVVTETSFGLANPQLAVEKGVELIHNSGRSYILKIPSADLLEPENVAAVSLKLTGYTDVYSGIAQKGLVLKYDEIYETYYLAKDESVADEELVRTNDLTISALADSLVEYTITVILEWAEEAPNEDTPVEEETVLKK